MRLDRKASLAELFVGGTGAVAFSYLSAPPLFPTLTPGVGVGGRSFFVCFSILCVGRLEAVKAHEKGRYGCERNVGCTLSVPEFQALREFALTRRAQRSRAGH